MFSINQVVLGGVAPKDAEVRTTSTGKTVASFAIGVDRWLGKAQGSGAPNTGDPPERKVEKEWFDVSCWGYLAEQVAPQIRKGDRLTVSGRLSKRKWTDKEGRDRTSWEVVAESIVYAGNSRRLGVADPGSAPEAPADASPAGQDDLPF